MAIKLRQGLETGEMRKYKLAQSTTAVANTFGTFSSGYLTPAVAGTTELNVLILESVTSGSGEHPEVLCMDLNENHTLECDTNVDTAQTNVGTKYDIVDSATVNLSFSTTSVVRVVGLVGATTDKKVLVKVSRD